MARKYLVNKNHFLDQVLRVNLAGEFAATEIYKGNIQGVCYKEKKQFKELLDHEEIHLDYFKQNIHKYSARPSLLMPLWGLIAKYSGLLSAKLSIKHAYFLTYAVESVIEQHYKHQIHAIENSQHKDEWSELSNKLKQFQSDEIEHKELATSQNVNLLFGYDCMNFMSQFFCKFAIKVATII
jgi:ubiquinone biosynthesis monooxygenase Coq7